MRAVFEFESYKAFLESKVGPKSKREGIKSKLARALNCQPTYISQVLHGNAHLSLEQADLMNQFFGLNSLESKYMLLLIQKDRAGTDSLRKHFLDQLNEVREIQMNVSNRIGKRTTLSPSHQTTYYSTWHYAAIHVALTLPNLQSPSALSAYFQIPLSRVNQVLEFLVEVGLAQKKAEDTFQSGETKIGLGKDSPNIYRHHTNWRVRAINSLEHEGPMDLHYSSVVSLSKKDIIKIKEQILRNLKENLDVIQTSPEEELYSYCIDFYNLSHR